MGHPEAGSGATYGHPETWGGTSESATTRGKSMTRPSRLEKALKAYKAVCDLVQNPVISDETRMYLAQLREALDAEINDLENQNKKSISA